MGVGIYEAGTQAFYGDITCNPMTEGRNCGAGGRYFCDIDPACAFNYAYAAAGYNYVVGVRNLNVVSVSKW